MEKNKFFYKKTFFHLFLPKNSRLFLKKLYESVDLMWFIAGDRSTDFNFYYKRMIHFSFASILDYLTNVNQTMLPIALYF